jgi:hypothetical protein
VSHRRERQRAARPIGDPLKDLRELPGDATGTELQATRECRRLLRLQSAGVHFGKRHHAGDTGLAVAKKFALVDQAVIVDIRRVTGLHGNPCLLSGKGRRAFVLADGPAVLRFQSGSNADIEGFRLASRASGSLFEAAHNITQLWPRAKFNLLHRIVGRPVPQESAPI